MIRLPVSGIEVTLRSPSGADDLLLEEASGNATAVGLLLLSRLARAAGEGHDWAELTVTDFEFLLLELRKARFGNEMTLGFACPECRARVEVEIRVSDFLADIRPRPLPGLAQDPSRAGWFLLEGAAFRIPTAGDQAEVTGLPDGAARLAVRCLDPQARKTPVRGRIERAMATLAPAVSRPLAGVCPCCAAAVEAPLHVARVVVGELRRAAAAVQDEIDLIARAYHWSEPDILALPQDRRRAYAERIRHAQAEAA
jgi:hypothetical protein